MTDYNVNDDKEWRDRHPNPSGIPDDGPLVHEHEGQTYTVADKSPQPVPDAHHEDGHVDPT